MKGIVFFILLLISIDAAAQPWVKVDFGGSRTRDTAYKNGSLRVDSSVMFLNYATSDTTLVLGFNSSGMAVLRHVSASGSSGWSHTDTLYNKHLIDSVAALTGGGGITPTQLTDSLNARGATYLPLSGGTINGNFATTDNNGNTIFTTNYTTGDISFGDFVSGLSSVSFAGNITMNGDIPITRGDSAFFYESKYAAATALTTKQPQLNGTGFVKFTGTTPSYDNTTYYPASNPNGYTSNTGTVTKDSAGYGLLGGNTTTSGYKAVDSTLQATRARVQKAIDSLNVIIGTKGAGTVTSVGISVPSAFSVTPTIITTSGTFSITGTGTTSQYIRGDGTLATTPTGTVTSVSGTAARISSTGGTTPVIDLVTANPTPATTGSGTAIPVITYDAYGRVTSATTATNTPAYANVTGTPNLAIYAPIASPTLTGTPISTTASAGTNTTQIATTAFVLSNTLNQLTAPSADLSINSHKLTNVLTPTATTDAANKAYVDNIASGINPAVAVQAATTANVPGYTYNNGVAGVGATLTQTAAAVVVIDGYTLLLNDRVLFKNQTTGANNGVYFISTLGTGIIPAVFTRALDYDQASDINNTGAIPVVNGTVNATTSWLITSSVTTVGTDAITYTQFSYNPTTLITTSTSAGGDLTGTYPNPTIVTVNATPATYGGSTAIPVIAVDSKGRATTITTSVVVAPAGTLSGSTLASGVTASSLTSLGTIGSLTATATTIATLTVTSSMGAWTDFSGTIAPTGYASGPTITRARYRLIGDEVEMQVIFTGTSNTTACTFTLPVAPDINQTYPINVTSSNSTAIGQIVLTAASTTATLNASGAGAAFGASNTKACTGKITYTK